MTSAQEDMGLSHKICRGAAMAVLALAIVSLLAAVTIPSAHGQTYRVIYSFSGGDGITPWNVIRDKAGNLYGTTWVGGDLTCGILGIGEPGCGTVFKIDGTGTLTVLHAFTNGADGAGPWGGVTGDEAGNLYGTTWVGGDLTCNAPYGCGIVFKVDAAGNYTVLHVFTDADGNNPEFSNLTLDAAGNIYGNATFGGAYGGGTVFKIDTAGKETVLHSFDVTHGSNPSSLLRDGAGNLYGTTVNGGAHNYGTVFKVGVNGKLTVLHDFAGPDGAASYAGLVRDGASNLYGTTPNGGAYGYGTVFKLNLKTLTETVLYSFTGGADGKNTWTGLVRDPAGNLYGTTTWGGAYGYGTVFKIDSTGKETVLHSFNYGGDGVAPQAALTLDRAGNLYGSTTTGGAYGYGIVFKVTP